MTLSESTKREIGQHFVLGFHGLDLNDDIRKLITEYYVGNVILMKRNVQDAQQVRQMINELQALAKDAGHTRPLMIGTDQENGLVSAFSSPTALTQFPGAMALAATCSPALTQEVYTATANELRLLGVNWAYSPVADVNSEKKNPVIGVRSFGDDPNEVAKYALAAATGLTLGGIAPSAKHFPGHGDTHTDSHLALPKIPKTRTELEQTELIPFKELIQNSVATIMTGHIALANITGTEDPSSLSRIITTDLLKMEMGFKGVVVTDCLEMDAIAAGYGVEEGAVRALEAGADIVMICHTMQWQVGAIEKTWKAVEEGRLDWDEIIESGEKIASLKDRFSTIQQYSETEWETTKAANAVLSEETYAKSIAVINEIGIPLASGRIILFTPEIESINKAVDDAEGVLRGKTGAVRNTAGASFLSLAKSVSKRSISEHVVYTKIGGTEIPAADGTTGIIFVLRNADRAMWQREFLGRVMEQISSIPIVVVSSCTPYDFVGLEGVGQVACFEYMPAAFAAAIAVIFGEKKAEGIVPVRL